MNYNSRKKMLLIVNPKSGKMVIKTELFKVIQIFSDAGYEVTVHTTTRRNDATDIARETASRFDVIVSCGGDGTLNETVTGVMDSGVKIPLGFIPVGTTNDLADTFGIPKQSDKAAKFIVSNPPTPNDVGLFNGTKYFNYVASCGAFTATSYSTPQQMKNSLGHMAYVLEGIKSIGDIKPIHMQIENEGETFEGDYIFAGVTNALSIGGVYKFGAKNVVLNDGHFEVMLIKSPKNPAEMVELLTQITNLETNSKFVTFFHSSEINIKTDSPTKWTVDGEYAGSLSEVKIKNLEKAVMIFKP